MNDAVPEAARAVIDAALRTGGDDDDDDDDDDDGSDAVTEAARAVIAAARSGDGDADGSSTMAAGLTRRTSPRRSGSYTSERGSEDEFESVANKGDVDGSATMAAGLTRRTSSTASSATKKRSATKAAVGASSTKKSKTKALSRKSVTPKEAMDKVSAPAATGPIRAAGVPPVVAAAYQSAVGLGGGTKPTASELAADKFPADLMAVDDSEENEYHSSKETSAAEPWGNGSKVEREGGSSSSKPSLQKNKIKKRVVSPSASRGSADEVESVTNNDNKPLAAEDLSLEDIESLYLRKKREREDAIAAAESLPLQVLEEICKKKKLKLSTIDLTTEDTGVVEPDGSGTSLQNIAKAAARLVVVKKEKDDAQEKLAAAKDDAEIFQETVQQQTLTTEIWQERFKEVSRLALDAGVDGKRLSSIRDRPLTDGH